MKVVGCGHDSGVFVGRLADRVGVRGVRWRWGVGGRGRAGGGVTPEPR